MSAPRTSKQPSLRLLLLGAVVVPLLVTLIVSLLLVDRASSRAVIAVARELQAELARSVTVSLQADLHAPHTLGALDAAAWADGRLPTTDDALIQHLLAELRATPSVAYTQLGRADGSFVGVERVQDGFRAEVTDPGLGGKAVWQLNERGERVGAPLTVVAGYDATTRPWYRAAVAAGKPTWSPIYQFSSREQARLGITAVRPVFSAEGTLLGVVGADLVLDQVDERLATNKLDQGGRIALFEPDGQLVAATGLDAPFAVDATRAAQRYSLRENPDEVLRGLGAVLDALPNAAETLSKPYEVTDEILGQPNFITVLPIQDGRGLDWRVAVIVPRAAIVAPLAAERQATGLFVLAVSLLAGLFALIIADRVAVSIQAFTTAAGEVARGKAATLPTPRIDELANLAESLRVMQQEVGRSRSRLEDALSARVAQARALEIARGEAIAAKGDAELASRAKSSFLASMSHELRTPLNAILGYADLLHEEADDHDPAALRADLDKIRTAGRHLLDLVNLVLDLSKVEAGRLEVHIVPLDLEATLNDAVDTVRPLIERNHNRLQLTFAGTPTQIESDAGRLRQILLNLLGNAAKFTNNGLIRVHSRMEGELLAIDVTDSGAGIPEADLDRIFDAFTQVDDPERAHIEGTGLGLSLVRRLAQRLGGDVRVRSKLGEGSTFTVTLPLVAPNETPAPAPHRP